jgi:hypothetical protein
VARLPTRAALDAPGFQLGKRDALENLSEWWYLRPDQWCSLRELSSGDAYLGPAKGRKGDDLLRRSPPVRQAMKKLSSKGRPA